MDKTAKKICAFILGLTAVTGFAVGYETHATVMRRTVSKIACKVLDAIGNSEVHLGGHSDDSVENEEEEES